MWRSTGFNPRTINVTNMMLKGIFVTFVCGQIIFLLEIIQSYRACRKVQNKINYFPKNITMIVNQ